MKVIYIYIYMEPHKDMDGNILKRRLCVKEEMKKLHL